MSLLFASLLLQGSRSVTDELLCFLHFWDAVNSTQLTCRFRNGLTRAFFLTREAILCFSPPDYGLNYIVSGTKESLPLAVSNNGADYVYVTGLKHASKILGECSKLEGKVAPCSCALEVLTAMAVS